MRSPRHIGLLTLFAAALLSLVSLVNLGASHSLESPGVFYTIGMLGSVCLLLVAYGARLLRFRAEEQERIRRAVEREKELAARVEEAVAQLKVLRGMLPICASCKKIRDDKGYWRQLETFIREHSEAEFSHGICPECFQRLYPDYADSTPTDEP